jgi:hypothetical protein
MSNTYAQKSQTASPQTQKSPATTATKTCSHVGVTLALVDVQSEYGSGAPLKTPSVGVAFTSVRELSAHVDMRQRCPGVVHVHVRFVPEN